MDPPPRPPPPGRGSSAEPRRRTAPDTPERGAQGRGAQGRGAQGRGAQGHRGPGRRGPERGSPARRSPGNDPTTAPTAGGWQRRWEDRLRRWVRGRRWWIRAPLLGVMGWILVRHLTDPRYASILHGLTLGFHELGHLLASFVGPALFTAAAGTLLQLAAPLAAAAYLLLRQHDPFGATFGTFWLGTSLVEAGRYIADARARVLPLVSPFGPVDATSHDWAFILSRLGLLEHDRVLGAMARDLGVLVMVLSLVAGAGVLRLMATTDRGKPAGVDSPETRGVPPTPEA